MRCLASSLPREVCRSTALGPPASRTCAANKQAPTHCRGSMRKHSSCWCSRIQTYPLTCRSAHPPFPALGSSGQSTRPSGWSLPERMLTACPAAVAAPHSWPARPCWQFGQFGALISSWGNAWAPVGWCCALMDGRLRGMHGWGGNERPSFCSPTPQFFCQVSIFQAFEVQGASGCAFPRQTLVFVLQCLSSCCCCWTLLTWRKKFSDL